MIKKVDIYFRIKLLILIFLAISCSSESDPFKGTQGGEATVSSSLSGKGHFESKDHVNPPVNSVLVSNDLCKNEKGQNISSQVEIEFKFTGERSVPTQNGSILSKLSVVGAFVHNGAYYSAPAFISNFSDFKNSY